MGQRAAADMLQPGLVVDDHIFVVADVLVDLRFQHAVDKAVAALALSPAHDQHVIVVLLHQRGAELHLSVIRLGHTGRHGAVLLGLCHLLADIAQRGLDLHAQHLVEVGIGIRVHHQQRALPRLAQIVDEHAAGGRFADATLTCHCNDMCLSHSLYHPFAFCGVRGEGCSPRDTGVSVSQIRSSRPAALAM